jgi:hypothetical protein
MKLAAAKPAAEPDEDALNRFGSETKSAAGVRPRRRVWAVVAVGCLTLLAAGVAAAVERGLVRFPGRAATITIDSTPAGAEVVFDGVSKGPAPVSFTAAPGEYAVEVVSGGQRVPLHVSAISGAVISHHVSFAAAAPPASVPTTLAISTDPPRLRVNVDNVDRGVSPVHVAGLAAGNHRIHVEAPSGAIDRDVDLHDGESLAVVMAAARGVDPAAAAGWISVAAPLSLRILENGQLVGTSDATRVMLAAGPHNLQFVNEDTGFRESRRVTVPPGKSAAVRIDVPNGRISINAVPWADVWVDTQHVGETPIGNFVVPIGTHQVIFRHPEFGERRERVTVSTREAARIAVDFGKR